MYSEEHRAELIEEIFAAFAWRQKPDKIWRTNVWEGKELERHVERVDPRDFTFELMERHVELRMFCEFIHFFTTQGFQFYLPSLMSLLLKDLFRSDGLVEVLIHTLHRIAPFDYPIERWPSKIEELVTEEELQQQEWNVGDMSIIRWLHQWFFERAHPEQNDYTYGLTIEEKRAIVLFLNYIETTQVFEPYEIVAVRSFYDGGSLSKRLGVVSLDDIASLIEVLELLGRKYPSRFHSQKVKGVVDQLLLEQSLF